MAWDVAKSLDKLLAQVNALAPNRSRRSDGSIGDAAHRAGRSDHNPEDKPGSEPDEVDARDITHDPVGGCDIGRIFEAIRLSCLAGREHRVKYLIFNRRYCSSNTGWQWRPYTGDNPHDKHGHISVNDVDDDSTAPWQVTLPGAVTTGGDDMSQKASQIVEAWAVGAPSTAAGDTVEPVKWRVRDEAWQAGVNAQLADLKTRPAGQVTVTAELMQALGDQVLRNVGPAVQQAVEAAIGAQVELAVRRLATAVLAELAELSSGETG